MYEADDPENGSIIWSLSGTHADDMAISGGNLTFNSPPDHETRDTYNVIVQAFDGNSTGTLTVVVTVTDINEDPAFPDTTTTRTVEENSGANAIVGLPVAAEDPDSSDTLTYILSGTGAASFTIDSNGQIRTKSDTDSDIKDIYNVTVEVHDGKGDDGSVSTTTDDYIDVTITVTDVNEPPVLTGSTSVELAENSTTTVATYTATDPERQDVSWDLSGADEDDFEIADGVLTFKSLPDREGATDADTDSVYHVTIVASDGNNNPELPVTITVTNVNERPEFPSTETGQRSVVENTGAHQTVGVPVAAIDPDRGDTLTYELGGQDASSFNFVTTTGQIQTKEALDSDSQASYAVTVSVRDSKDADGNADTATDDTISVTITVTDINEPPVVTGTTTTEYAENDTRAVETYTATDPENDHITWSLSGTDSDAMDITPSGGELTFNDPPNYEDKSVFLVTVQASDGHSTTTHAVRINITDINERPEFSGATTSRSVVENTPAGRNIGLPVVAADQDRGDALTYILDNSAVEFFDIDETTGQLKTKSELNAESRATYNVYVDVHDGKDDEGSPDTTVDAYIYVTITIENVDEPPVVTGTTSTEFVENSALTVAVYDARDPEGETVIWSLSGDDADSFEITIGALSFLKSPDYEAKSQYSITVDASDGGLTSSLNVNVTITNEDEGGAIDLSSQQPQAGTPLTATLEDPDGNLAGDTWVWESSTSSSWSAISGATSRSYTPGDGDVDSFLRVTASYTDGHGSGKSAQAGATHSVRAAPIQNTAPEFQGTTTSREVAENSGPGVNIGAPVTATDAQQNDTLNYTLSGTDESFFSIDSQTGQLKTSASLNHEGKETYTVIVTASDPSNAKDTITVTITVTDVDEVPELTGRTTVEHVETATGPVHTFTAKDPEEGTITWGLSGDDEEDFTIAGGNLNFASTPDLENPADADGNNVYRVTVEASDGTSTSTLAVTVIVIGVNEPAVFPGATTSRDVTENTPAGQNVGAPVSASDPEKDDLTYTLGGTHRQRFDIATSTGQILTKGALNYEGTKSYPVTVSVTDGRNTDGDTDTVTDASIQVTINVLDENEAPEITGLSSRNWNENATGTVATYSADDPENATTTWTVDGTDKAHFAITEEGVLSIGTVPDYENPADSDRNNVYQIAVQAADDGNIISRYDVTINIVNVDEDGVVQVSPSQPEVGTLVNAELSDPDGVTSVPTWVWWRSSTANGPWSNISNATASSYMPTTADEDNYLRATVSYTDQQGSGKSASGVTANAVQAGPQTNNAPAFLPNTVRNVDENTVPEQPIGDPVAAQDAQSDDNLVYELGGTDADSFGFSTSTGQLYTKAALDYETKPSYTVTITVSDGKNVDNGVDTSTDDTITVTINVTDVNEPPTLTGPSTAIYAESATGPVATFTVTDPENDDITLEPGGEDGTHFRFSGTELHFNVQPDYEAPQDADKDRVYHLTVEADDKNSTTTIDLTVTVTNVNEPPQFPNGDSGARSVTENTATGQNVGAPVSASDPEKDQLTYTLSGTDASYFGIKASTGQILAKAELNYEGRSRYLVTVSVRDSKNVDGNPDAVTDVTITVENVNEPPVVTGTTTTEYVENGTVSVATYTVVDPEYDNISWSPLGGDGGAFTMSASGVLSFRTPPDFEAKEGYRLTVNAFDGELTDTLDVTITITNVNEPPVVTGRAAITFVETATGPVETFDANDPEEGDIEWEVLGTDADDFTITDGALNFASGPDHEHPTDSDPPLGDNVYDIVVKATDDEGLDDELPVTVIVTDVNQVPVFPGATTTREVSENLAPNQNVGSPVSATDPENDILTYSLSGTHATLFDIATSTGQVLTKSELDYEGTKTYSVIVSVTDKKNPLGNDDPTVDDTIEVTINVINDNEAPEISGPSTANLPENATGTVATYSANDPESATTTWSLDGPDKDELSISDGGVLSIDNAPNYEAKNFYQITVRASDGPNIADLDVTITITNVDEPGTVTLSPTSPEVGTPVNAHLTDPDLFDSITGWSWHRSPDKISWGSPIAGAAGSAYTPVNANEGMYLQATVHYEDGHGGGKTATGVTDNQVPTTNSQPAFSQNTFRSVDENTEAGQPIGDPVQATERQQGDTLTYSLGGDDADSFDFTTSTGQLLTKEPLDFEGKSSYSVTVSVSDGKDVDNRDDTTTDDTITVTINVNDVDEAPEVTGTTPIDFPENSTSTVGTFTAVDPEKRTTFIWVLSGNDVSALDISGGVLSFNSPPNYESKSSYSVTVQAYDGRETGTLEVTVNVTNVDEVGTVKILSNQPQIGTALTAELTDPDEGIEDVTWTWESSSGQANWTTVSTTTPGSATSTSYTPDNDDDSKSLRATAAYTDGEGSGKSASAISANQVQQPPPTNDAPEFPVPATRTIPENTPADQNIGDPVIATDAQDEKLTYTLGGADAESFDIDKETGQLKTKAELDREAKETYTVTVTAKDGSEASDTITVTITVTDVNEPPTLTGPSTAIYAESATGPVATFTVTDPENDDITLEPEGADGTHFRFSGTELHFNAQPDYEAPQDADKDRVYHLTVVADDKNSTSSIDVTVTVTNVNEPPQFPNGDSGTRSVTENTATGQNVGAPVSASDPEKDSLHYNLSGRDAKYFDINPSTGQILAKADLNYESRTSYPVTVSVRDSKNVDDNPDVVTDDAIDITINVIGENEAPVITGATSTNFAENGTRAVASYRGRDPEGGSVSWTLLGTDSAYFAITTGGVLSFDPAPDFENEMDSDRNNVYHVTVQASDGNNISRLEMTVTVTNVEEAGTVELSSVQPQVDTPLTATLDDPDEVTSAITWSWQRSRANSKSSWSTISGATSDSYTPAAGDVGRYLRAIARYNDGYGTGKRAQTDSENMVRAVPTNNNPPRFLSQFTTRTVDENTGAGENIGDPVTAMDDPTDNLTYRIGGTDAAMFRIVRSTGQVQTRMPLDYESRTGYSVSVTAADPSTATSSIRVTITVVNIDEPPVAVGDTARATEDGSAVTINVLDNDSDPEGKALTLATTTQPTNGTAVAEGHVVKYTPNPGYYGSDAFTYTVSDGGLTSDGNVSVIVDADSDLTVQDAIIPIQFVPIDGGGERILLSDYFSDPDEGHPPYQATTSDSAIATVEISEGYLTITPVGIGVATTTLTVSDTPGINQEFRVVVYRPVVERTTTETVFT